MCMLLEEMMVLLPSQVWRGMTPIWINGWTLKRWAKEEQALELANYMDVYML